MSTPGPRRGLVEIKPPTRKRKGKKDTNWGLGGFVGFKFHLYEQQDGPDKMVPAKETGKNRGGEEGGEKEKRSGQKTPL